MNKLNKTLNIVTNNRGCVPACLMVKMRVLVVGASGLLGRGLMKAFTAAGHEVSAREIVRARLAPGAPKTVECPRRHKIKRRSSAKLTHLCRVHRSQNIHEFICARVLV
jgi:nucleoside-diphosphate-sugar epimerase